MIIEGYHGTKEENVKSIKKNNFRINYNRYQWLGKGVYFFLDSSFSNPVKLARKWAKAESWDNKQQCMDYYEYSILKAEIIKEEDVLLDVTTDEGKKCFNYFREKLREKLKKFKIDVKDKDWHEGVKKQQDYYAYNEEDVYEKIKEVLGIEIIINNLYIKFSLERMCNLESETPNCKVVSVSNTDRIKTETIVEEEKGGIKNEF